MAPRVLTFALSLAAGLLPSAAMASAARVDTFTQAAGAAQQVSHTLGMTPRAIVVWSDGQVAAQVVGRGSSLAFGVSDGTTSYTIGTAIIDNSPTVQAGRMIAPALITFDSPTGVQQARATLSAWDAATFSLAWSPNDGVPRLIHYLLIGGADVSAKAVTFLTPTVTGPFSVTGVGFIPDVVVSLFAATANSGLPSSSAALHAHISVASLGPQWTVGTNVNTTLSNAYFLPHAIGVSQTNPQMTADLVAMGPDGFTFDASVAPGAAIRIMSLALRGPMKVGVLDKPLGTAPYDQVVTGLGFSPGAVLVGTTFNDAGVPTNNARLCLGAGAPDRPSGVRHGASVFSDVGGTLPTNVTGVDSATELITQAVASPADRAVLLATQVDGFSLRWQQSSVRTFTFGYLAVGQEPDAGLPDAGSIDGGSTDAGSTDAGAADAGSSDAGSSDAGSSDAGSSDAGFGDAGPGDAGAAADAGSGDGGTADAGNRPSSYGLGCGCHSAALPAIWAALGLWLVRPRRRRKR